MKVVKMSLYAILGLLGVFSFLIATAYWLVHRKANYEFPLTVNSVKFAYITPSIKDVPVLDDHAPKEFKWCFVFEIDNNSVTYPIFISLRPLGIYSVSGSLKIPKNVTLTHPL
jgi:hypothetical protein